MPRGMHESHGLSTTRAPVSDRCATTSWPSTCGNESNAVSGLSSAPCRKICLVSDPQIPLTSVSHSTQSPAGATGSATSSSRVGATALTNVRGDNQPPIRPAASRGRLWRNTSPFMRSRPCVHVHR